VAYIDRGTDRHRTPEKYVSVHRDIMDRRFPAVPFRDLAAQHAGSTAALENRRRRDDRGPSFG